MESSQQVCDYQSATAQEFQTERKQGMGHVEARDAGDSCGFNDGGGSDRFFQDYMIDPEDGMLDGSRYLSEVAGGDGP